MPFDRATRPGRPRRPMHLPRHSTIPCHTMPCHTIPCHGCACVDATCGHIPECTTRRVRPGTPASACILLFTHSWSHSMLKTILPRLPCSACPPFGFWCAIRYKPFVCARACVAPASCVCSPWCFQNGKGKDNGASEDCLQLNVYQPRPAAGAGAQQPRSNATKIPVAVCCHFRFYISVMYVPRLSSLHYYVPIRAAGTGKGRRSHCT